jgi:2,3-bisphosphoglycerate-dependent phosphoglycerate mutase
LSLSVWVGKHRFEIGDSSFLKSFFSTVFVRLEDEDWGSRYPTIMEKFYSGRVGAADLGAAGRELGAIRESLQSFSPDQVVWDFEDREAQPPWGERVSAHITSLANYFTTSDGKDLIDVFSEAFRTASRTRQDVTIS